MIYTFHVFTSNKSSEKNLNKNMLCVLYCKYLIASY